MKNVKELLNLFITEHQMENSDIANTKRLNIGYFRMLSDFLMMKMKSSDTFNMLIEKEVFNDINEFQNQSYSEFDMPSPSLNQGSSEKNEEKQFWKNFGDQKSIS